jgi:hypothetical protein
MHPWVKPGGTTEPGVQIHDAEATNPASNARRPSTVPKNQMIPRYIPSASGLSSNLRKVVAARQLSLIRSPDAPVSMRKAGWSSCVT